MGCGLAGAQDAAPQEDDGEPRAAGIFLTQPAREDLTGEEEETLLAAADAAAACRAGRTPRSEREDLDDPVEGEGAVPGQHAAGDDPLDDGTAPEAAAPCAPSSRLTLRMHACALSSFAVHRRARRGSGSMWGPGLQVSRVLLSRSMLAAPSNAGD